jgi:hypothetical protein
MLLPALPLAWRSALVLLGAASVGWELSAPTTLPLAAPPPHTAMAGSASAVAAAPAHAAYSAIGRHPLFSPTRQPWVPPPAAVDSARHAAPAPPAGFAVIGTVVGGGIRRAIVRPPNGDTTILLAEGQQLQGWTLRRIGRESLRFERAAATWQLRLSPPGSGHVTQAGR